MPKPHAEFSPVQPAMTTYLAYLANQRTISWCWTAAKGAVYCMPQSPGLTYLSEYSATIASWTSIALPPGMVVKQDSAGTGGGFYSDTRDPDGDNPRGVYFVVSYKRKGGAYPPKKGWYLPLPVGLAAGDYIVRLDDPFGEVGNASKSGGPTGEVFCDKPAGNLPPVTVYQAPSAPKKLGTQIAVCRTTNKSGELIFVTDMSGVLWCLTNSNTPYWTPISQTASPEDLGLGTWTAGQPKLDPSQPIAASRVSQLNYPVVFAKMPHNRGIMVFYAAGRSVLRDGWPVEYNDQPGNQTWFFSPFVASYPSAADGVDPANPPTPGNSMAAITVPGGDENDGEFPVPLPDSITLFIDMSDGVYQIGVKVAVEEATGLPQPAFPPTITYTGFVMTFVQRGLAGVSATPKWIRIGSPSHPNMSPLSFFQGTEVGFPVAWELDYQSGYALAATVGAFACVYARCVDLHGRVRLFVAAVGFDGEVYVWRDLCINTPQFPSNFNLADQPNAGGHPKSQALVDITVGSFFCVNTASGTSMKRPGEDLVEIGATLVVPGVHVQGSGSAKPESYSVIAGVVIPNNFQARFEQSITWGVTPLIR